MKTNHPIINLFINLLNNRKSKTGLYLVVFILTYTYVGSFFTLSPTEYVDIPLLSPSLNHFFGTNGQGQDVFAQTIIGGQQTLLVGFISGFFVVLFGSLIGGISGYYQGRTDDILSLVVNIFLLIPGLPLMVILAAWLPSGPSTIIAVLVITGWAWHARVIRSQVLAFSQQEFVLASKVCGESDFRIITVEILPRMLSLLMSSFIGATVYSIGAQVGLEFLGLGDISIVTWGTNLYWASNDLALLTGSWWTFIPTGVSIAFVGFGLTLLNYGIDEISNPRLTSEKILKNEIGKDFNRNGITPFKIK